MRVFGLTVRRVDTDGLADALSARPKRWRPKLDGIADQFTLGPLRCGSRRLRPVS